VIRYRDSGARFSDLNTANNARGVTYCRREVSINKTKEEAGRLKAIPPAGTESRTRAENSKEYVKSERAAGRSDKAALVNFKA
jgi:hypothetical protein